MEIFNGNINDALDLSNFPKDYANSLKEELIYLKKIVKGNVLDIGCGDGRIIPFLDEDLVKNYTGFDIDKPLLKRAELIDSKFPKKFVNGDAHKISSFFIKNSFDIVLGTFATFGLLKIKDLLKQVLPLFNKQLFFSVNKKGALDIRLDYYKNCGIKVTFDKFTETIYSNVWGEVRAYSLEDLKLLGEELGLKMVDSGSFGRVMIYGLFEK